MQKSQQGELIRALYMFPYPSDIVVEFIRNSLQSGATKIKIVLGQFSINVIDNGAGFSVTFKMGQMDPGCKPHFQGRSLKVISELGALGIYSNKRRVMGNPLACEGTRVSITRLYEKVLLLIGICSAKMH